MTDEQQPNGTDQTSVGDKSPATSPTVTARRPISKAEYARTTHTTPDETAIIPAVKDDGPGDVEAPAKPDVKAPGAAAQKAPTKKAAAKKSPAKKVPAKKAPFKGAAAAEAVSAGAPPAPAGAKTETAKTETAKTEPVAPKQPVAPKPVEAAGPATKTAPAAPAPPPVQAPAASADAAADSSRSAKLKLTHVEPWSVTKMAFVVSVALMIVSVVAVTVFWVVLQITGVWDALNDSVSNVLADDSSGFDITDYLGFGRLVGLTLLLSALNVIFMTALSTIGAHLYNLSTGLLGGVELTFGERK